MLQSLKRIILKTNRFKSFFVLAALLLLGTSPAAPYTVAAFKKLAPQSGSYAVYGYVSLIYTCPPCPPDALCKPCMPDNIVLTDSYEEGANYSTPGVRLVILTDQTDKLQKGKKYLVELKVEQSSSFNFGLNDLTLIKFSEIPAAK